MSRFCGRYAALSSSFAPSVANEPPQLLAADGAGIHVPGSDALIEHLRLQDVPSLSPDDGAVVPTTQECAVVPSGGEQAPEPWDAQQALVPGGTEQALVPSSSERVLVPASTELVVPFEQREWDFLEAIAEQAQRGAVSHASPIPTRNAQKLACAKSPCVRAAHSGGSRGVGLPACTGRGVSGRCAAQAGRVPQL